MSAVKIYAYLIKTLGRRWQCRRMLGSLRPADRLDSTHIGLNNPENRWKTSRMDSPEPSIDKRPTEEGRKGGEAVRATWTGRRDPGRRRGSQPTRQGRAPKSGLPKWRGWTECVLTASGT